MLEQEFIKKCLIEIEKQLKWGASQNWTTREFTELSYLISEKTGISISVSSLRRVFGKSTDYRKVYNPQLETKNALVKFIGYTDWHSFKFANPIIKKQINFNGKNIALAVSFLTIVIIAVLLAFGVVFKSNDTTPKKQNFIFEGQNLTSNELPHTVIINYNIEEFNKPMYIDWDDVSPDATGGSEYTILTSDSGKVTHTYFFKDKYNIHLLDSNFKVIKDIHSIIYTNNWECFVYQEGSVVLVDSVNFFNNNKMYPNSNYLVEKGVVFTKPYRVLYRNLSNFNISGQEYSLSTEFKPEFRKDYVECGHVQIEIVGSEGGNLITLMQNGCAGQLNAIYLNKLTVSGKINDLSAFSIIDRQWYSFNFDVKKDSTTIYLNEQMIYQVESQPSIGDILGIRLEFLGNGTVKNVVLK